MWHQVTTLVGFLLEASLMSIPVLVLMGLLRHQRAREARLSRDVMNELTSWEPGQRVIIRARCPLIGGPPIVTVDLRHCSAEAWWNAIGGLYLVLPSSARLEIKGTIEQRRRAAFVIEAAPVERPLRVGRL